MSRRRRLHTMTTRSRRTPEAVDPPPRRHGLTVTLTAIGFSVLAHLSAAFTLELPAVLPDLGIDLHMPSEIEFGLTHGVEADVSNSLGKAATNTEGSRREIVGN